MSLIHVNCFSECLGVKISFYAILPQPRPVNESARYTYDDKLSPTLYLLHGLSDHHTVWPRQPSIERYVEPLDLAVIMPAVNRSFYTDMAHGAQYWTFVSEELPALARRMFPLSVAREDNFVAGLSMGGYGAFKLALRRPECFAMAVSLSGSLDMVNHVLSPGELAGEFKAIFGEPSQMAGSENDLFALAQRAAQTNVRLPKLVQYCGTEDFLLEDNRKFQQLAAELGLDLTYEEGPGGHTWHYWDAQIQKVVQILRRKDC